MFHHKLGAKVLFASLVLFVSTILSTVSFAPAVFADTQGAGTTAASTTDTAQVAPNGSVQISPICSDATTDAAYWQVNNTNSFDATVNWTAIDNGHSGSYDAASGTTTLTTYYDGTDPNNTTTFVIDQDSVSRNATTTPCSLPTQPTQPTPPACVDGSIQQNLTYSFSASDTVTVQTVNGQPLCNDVTVEFSSYIMPADYNGAGFTGNSTAYPQTIYSTTSATLAAGSTGQATLHITLPASCNNVQTDLYYAPEIDTVGSNGQGTQNIVSDIYPSTGSCQTQPIAPTNPPTPPVTTPPTSPVTGGKGGGGEGTITAVITPAAATVAAPAATVITPSTGVLTDTGESSLLPSIIALSLIAGAVIVARKQSYQSPN